jgi:hypothetical protein
MEWAYRNVVPQGQSLTVGISTQFLTLFEGTEFCLLEYHSQFKDFWYFPGFMYKDYTSTSPYLFPGRDLGRSLTTDYAFGIRRQTQRKVLDLSSVRGYKHLSPGYDDEAQSRRTILPGNC